MSSWETTIKRGNYDSNNFYNLVTLKTLMKNNSDNLFKYTS